MGRSMSIGGGGMGGTRKGVGWGRQHRNHFSHLKK